MRLVSKAAKLTPAQVRKARKLWHGRFNSQKEIADLFGVSQPTISNVLRGRVYRKVA
jgi:predicted XRE-type DNA-binding protein